MEEYRVSYIQRFILICRLKSTHMPILFCGRLFAWENLFDCLPWAYHILTLLRMITYFKHHALLSQNFCIWSIPLTENIPLILYLTCLAANLIITVVRILYWCRFELSVLLWGVHTNAKLIISLKIRFFPFHCSRLRIPFCLAEFRNIWTPYYFFESGVSSWATIYRGEIM